MSFQGNLIPNHLQVLKGLPGLSINKKTCLLVSGLNFEVQIFQDLVASFQILNTWLQKRMIIIWCFRLYPSWRRRSGNSHWSIAQNVDASLFFGVCDACIALFDVCHGSRKLWRSTYPLSCLPPAWGFIFLPAKGKWRLIISHENRLF